MGKHGLCSPDPEAVLIDGVSYSGRYMDYHPDFHPQHGEPFSVEDLEYLSMFYGFDDIRTVAFALGRTEKTIQRQYSLLRNKGLIDHFRQSYLKKVGAN